MDARLTRLSCRDFWGAVASLAMPRTCLVCGRPLLLQEKHLCLACRADLPLMRGASLPQNPMADRYNALVEKGPYEYACALFYYSGAYRNIPRAVKYGADLKAGRHFGRMLGETLSASPLFQDVDMVIPVPLHWTRRWRRGYNQAAVIARQVALVLGCPCEERLLRRIRRTRTQTRLRGESKAENVRQAFRARAGKTGAVRHILLVDDVCTSGATLASCQKALRACVPDGVRISAATLAFVGE